MVALIYDTTKAVPFCDSTMAASTCDTTMAAPVRDKTIVPLATPNHIEVKIRAIFLLRGIETEKISWFLCQKIFSFR